jgi:phosphatidylinositol kinase/protein kinase (PI-3  family)
MKGSSRSRTPKDMSGEDSENSEAVKHLGIIDQKLKGIMKFGLPLSIEGQVAELINEATDPENLAVMYIGKHLVALRFERSRI